MSSVCIPTPCLVIFVSPTAANRSRSEDAKDAREKLSGVDGGVKEVLDTLRPLRKTVYDLQPEFRDISRSLPLATEAERDRVAEGLWVSITAANECASATPVDKSALGSGEDYEKIPIGIAPDDQNDYICDKILNSLEFNDIRARESQITTPFPETFAWLLQDGSSKTPSVGFKEWLESKANDTPFWITGKPASGKSTLMKYICNHPRVEQHLRAWSGEFQLLTCSVYFWNPGSSGQKSQLGLLRTLLYQLLQQRPDLYRHIVSTRYLYFQLAGRGSPDRPDWTHNELQDCLVQFMTQVGAKTRLAMFIDGLDEYDGDHQALISFLKDFHSKRGVKLCVSSRPWPDFTDAFCTYPSLEMERLTKPDIVKYVRTRIGDSLAFRELRALDPETVDKLETQIINKAEGVFLWVVLVTEKIISTARGNNDLHEIWKIFNSLPSSLEKLYDSMLKRLDPAQREVASKMYQLLFQWKGTFAERFGMLEFWAAINCHDPTEPQFFPTASKAVNVLPALKRRLAGITGGVLQVLDTFEEYKPTSGTTIEFLHRTVYDWLTSIKTSIIEQGPSGYDPVLVLTAVLVSRYNAGGGLFTLGSQASRMSSIFQIARLCNDSSEARKKLLAVMEQLDISEWHWDDIGESSGLKSVPDSVAYSCLAVKFLCPPYLQAKLENGSKMTGLELPLHLRFMPTKLWDKTSRGILSVVLGILGANPHDRTNPTDSGYTLRLKTIELLIEAKIVPRRVLRARVNKATSNKALRLAILNGLAGRGWN